MQMLEQLRAKRDHEPFVGQVNELKVNPELNKQKLTDLSKSLKSTHLESYKNKQSALESILYRTRFESIFSLAQKAKYSHLNQKKQHRFLSKKDRKDFDIDQLINIVELNSHLVALQTICDGSNSVLLFDKKTNKILKSCHYTAFGENLHK